MKTTIKPKFKKFLEEVKKLLIDVYGENPEHIHVDDEENLVNYTGYGHGAEGGIRCETMVPMYDILIADDFPACPEGYFCEPINSWSFGVYKV